MYKELTVSNHHLLAVKYTVRYRLNIYSSSNNSSDGTGQ